MPPDLPARLARKWVEVKCSKCGSNSVWCPHPELRVAAAIREALEEAEQAILTGYLNQYPDQDSQDDAAMRRAAAVAIAALREGG